MSTLLVLTVGQTDVQVVIGDARRELRKDRCAALHDQIERRAWRIVEAPHWKANAQIETLPDGELLLCTPKLDAVLREGIPSTALVLETRRDASFAPGDPRIAGVVLERRLKERGVERVDRRSYLVGTERLEDSNNPRDAVIRREVVCRLEDAVREGIKHLRPSRIAVATTGGFPEVARLVEEIVRLHALAFPASVEVFEVADGALASPPGPDRAVKRTSVPEPLVSFQARRRALELIEKGNLLGAWAIAEPLRSDPVESAWTKVIEWLACFASSMPIPDECDIPLLKHRRMAVRAALRVEFALRAGDIPRAVQSTVAFFEAAFWDWLREYDFDGEGITRLSEVSYQLPASPSGELKRRFRKSKNGTWRVNDFEDGIRAWLPCLNRRSLQAFWGALSDDIRNLRHDVAHNEPTPQLMNDARRLMTEAGLWSPGDRFLTQEIVQDVLDELGERNPDSVCDNLIATVRTRLLEHRPDGA